MLPALLGKKLGMTQVYDDQGVLHPVTVVQAGPCKVLQVKNVGTDGYDAVQIGFDPIKPHRARKPQIGHAAKAGAPPHRFVREVRLDQPDDQVAPGQTVTVEIFEGVGFVDVIGTSKGRGFAGVVRRHGFRGQPATHGTQRKHRSPGSIGGHAADLGKGPTIKKGKRMAGHMGNVRCTTRNHKLVAIDKENNLLLIRGSVPGPNGGFVFVRAGRTARAARRTRG